MTEAVGKQAALWLSEQVGDVGFAEAGQHFGVARQAVRSAWLALKFDKTPRAKMKDDEDPAVAAAAQHTRKLVYMREYNARTSEQHSLYNKQWYQDHKEDAKAKARQYRLDNPEKTKEAQALWRVANKERLVEYNKAYQELNQKRIAQTAREKRLLFFSEHPKEAWLYYTLPRARGRAKRRGLPYDVDPAGLVLPDFCPVLLIPLNYSERRGKPADDSPSLDRVVPPRGYVTPNLRVISWRANVLKRDASVDEIRRVLAYVEECLSLEETC